MPDTREFMTVRELSEALGCDPGKVLCWIASGELAALNIAERATGRPRWRIPREAWERFQAARSNRKSDPPRRQARRQPRGPDQQIKAYY